MADGNRHRRRYFRGPQNRVSGEKRYYEQILEGIPEDTREIGKAFSNYVLATKGLMMAETELKWCDWVLELLRQQQHTTASKHGRTNFETLS